MNWQIGKAVALKKGNYRGLKLTDQNLKRDQRIIKKLIRQNRLISTRRSLISCQFVEIQKKNSS